jgi:TonB family protein
MRRYLVISSGTHVFLLAGWLASGALLTKPRMSYYAIDVMSSLPAGGPAGGSPAVVEPVKAPPPPTPPAVEQRKLPAKEMIQVQGKPKKPAPAPPKPQKKHGLNLKAALAVLDSQGKEGRSAPAGMPGAGGSGIVAEAGPAFPYPWYLEAIADRLNKQWHPPQDFQADMLCQIAFVIERNGQVGQAVVEKGSGDATFDQLAQRAILYANPLPPLPAGFPDETLHVHMKFVGKPL